MKSETTNDIPVSSSNLKSAVTVLELKKILVPVDFSEGCRKALQYAIPFARQFAAELMLLHVVEPTMVFSNAEVLPQNFMEPTAEAEAELDSLQQEIGANIVTKTLVRAGSPHVEILDAAKELNVDLIILSTHGRTGLEHVLLGSTAEKVVRRAGCPVLVVREHEHDFIHVSSENESKAPG